MKRHAIRVLSLLLALSLWTLPTADAAPSAKAKTAKSAKGDKAKKADKEKEQASLSAVGAAVEGIDTLTDAKPATDADYYIYLSSASWCGPCNAEMPEVVKQYERMREDGRVELILVSGDQDPQAAVGFMQKYGAVFPAVAPQNGVKLPGYTQPSGIPNAIFVDSEGKVIRNGHGSLVMQWEALTINNPDCPPKSEPGKKALKDSSKDKKDKKDAKDKKEGSAVATALKKLKPFNGKPSAKADMYIYLQSASWCGPCQKEMPRIVEEYKEMKKSGKAEIILVCHDKTEADAKAYVKQHKAKFPVVMVQHKDIETLPGFSKPNGIPNAIFVDKDGKVLMQGHGSLIETWKDRLPKSSSDAE